MLVMQPLRMRDERLKFKFKLKLDDKDLLDIQNETFKKFASIQVVLRQVVLSTLLVLRLVFYFVGLGRDLTRWISDQTQWFDVCWAFVGMIGKFALVIFFNQFSKHMEFF